MYWLIIAVFVLAYLAIIFEHNTKISKTAVGLLAAVFCWVLYFFSGGSLPENLRALGERVSEASQIVFFLMGAMTLVELIDAHKGFKIITDLIEVSSKRATLWVIALITFFLSAVLDNLTTTILMISLLRKMVPEKEDRFTLGCLVVIAANAGGAWTVIGDVTTTMLWINGQISSLAIMKALFAPSLVALIVPLLFYTCMTGGTHRKKKLTVKERKEPGGRLVFYLGLGSLIFIPVFKWLTGLPPFMGVFIGLGALWAVTDIIHHKFENRQHLRIPQALARIDTSGALFFLGILLTISALASAGILSDLAHWLGEKIPNLTVVATLIGLASAVVDNVPLVAASMGMYPLDQFPGDSSLWHMIAYAAGTGGSILIIGSAAGIAFMGMEKVDFLPYFKRAAFPALIGYLAGMGTYLIFP